MKITFDFTKMQEADDGNTTYFGGTATINGTTVQLSGNDRSGGVADVVIPEVERQLGRPLSEAELDEHFSVLHSGERGVVTIEFK